MGERWLESAFERRRRRRVIARWELAERRRWWVCGGTGHRARARARARCQLRVDLGSTREVYNGAGLRASPPTFTTWRLRNRGHQTLVAIATASNRQGTHHHS